ncbi:surface antigen-like protein [Pontibacter ummariensis]|uniref:Surface antigen n=1 Tax=Pontibacter ummariensis TaxID=1610492 RepID=A0A239JYS7_9BACT|nr:BamA/TamA family outer membrane protein [Pontibacter ummariensis]PRY07280.1 surface antigen-like protein [Pontibacter ummariensis]SNT10563.1 Surface antigen [Pontibacter ummariensis]
MRTQKVISFCISLLLFGSVGSLAQTNPEADSITVAIAPVYNQVSESHKFFLGDNYRKLWATPVKMKVFRLNEEKGGMVILQKGGGQQTKSLRLQDAAGNEWVLRTIQKDPGLALPESLRETVAKAIVQDQISASHPFGALVVPPLAAALGIPHANPEVVYLPDDPALGEYREEFANQVYLFEEREPVGVKDTDNTEKVLEKLEEDNDNRVHQRLVLRARLLDMLIGDWDRHEDQWRWIETEDEIGDYYLPVPRDRDQVFFTNQGLIPKIGSRKWIMPKFQGFDRAIRDIEGFNFNARYFDRRFLTDLGESDWREEVASVQQTLTDSLLEQAVRRMPAGIYALSGEEILQKLMARRNSLGQDALAYYRFLAKAVDIPGSDEEEFFEVQYAADGKVRVTVYNLKNDNIRGRVLYQRTFDPETTEEVRLYGRDGEDVFSVAGTHVSPIRVRMIGGGEEDVFNVPEDFQNSAKLYIYDRSDKDNTFPDRSLARLKVSSDSTVNAYEPRAFEYDVLMPLATAGYNLDDGVLLGVGFQYTKHGFRKAPFAARHRLVVGHALATKAFFAEYEAFFTKVFSKYDLSINLDARAPNNTSNFFGVGNETAFIEEGDKPIRYYRTRYDFVNAQVKLHRSLGRHWSANAGLLGQFYDNDQSNNRGRFIVSYAEQNPGEEIFGTKVYTGLVAELDLDTRDALQLPTRGLHWNTSLVASQQLNEQQNAYAQVISAVSFYVSPGSGDDFTIANRFGGGTTVGDPAFFQLLYLGGNRNLRGFRNFRFAGESMAYHNLELRLKLFDFTSYLFPGTLGLIGFHDVGRVWADRASSDVWHNGYGGGFYLVPAKLVLVQALLGFSEEDTLPYVAIGFRF